MTQEHTDLIDDLESSINGWDENNEHGCPTELESKAAAAIRSLSGDVEKREGANRQLVEELGRASDRLEHRSEELSISESELKDARELLERLRVWVSNRSEKTSNVVLHMMLNNVGEEIDAHLSRTKEQTEQDTPNG